MGSWGVTAHQSDYGLDLLAVAEERYLYGVKFKEFHVRHITELLRAHIVDEFSKESVGWESHYIDFFYEYTFPYHFAEAVMVIAESFAEYRKKKKYRIYDFKSKRNRHITNFIYTDEDLKYLLTELQSVLDPKHALYKAWKDSERFDEWQSHIRQLCETLRREGRSL